MTYKVVVADSISGPGIDELESDENFEVVSTAADPSRLSAELQNAHALLVRSATHVTEALLATAPRLRVIGRAGIGVDNIDLDAATRRGIAVLNAPGANTVSAAEHTFALLLALVRHVPGAVESMRRGEWDRARFGGNELRGKTMGLVGLGRIGLHVAGIAKAFGMRVLAHDPFMTESRAKEVGVTLRPLDDLLREVDVLSFHAPLTDDTRHLLNAKRLASMKPTAIVVNAARGPLIDTAALVQAIQNHRLAGAALDVFDEEPLDRDSVLRNTDNILVTPHLAASTNEAQERVSVEICRFVRKALETGDVGGAVNVPSVSSEVLNRAREAMALARRLGRLAGHIAKSAVTSIEMSYGGRDDEVAKPVQLAAVEGVLESMGVGPVSLVNAAVLAEDRSIALSRRVTRPVGGFERSIGVRLQTPNRAVSVVGVLAEGRLPRVIQIDEFVVDIPAHGTVLILRNKDVPGVIGQVGTILGEADINIGFYHQARAEHSNEALAAIAVDHTPSQELLSSLQAVPEVLDVKFARLDGDSK